MGLWDFVQEMPRRSIDEIVGELIVGYRRRSNWLENRGINVFDRDWDLLILLDGCRVDALREVSSEYDFLTSTISELQNRHTIEAMWSVGGTSDEWMTNTFGATTQADLECTGYVTANPYSADAPTDGLGYLDEVWRDEWNVEQGTVLPDAVTDRAIDAGRCEDLGRMIVHYMQPHEPMLDHPEFSRDLHPDRWGNADSIPLWDQVRDGDIARDNLWEAYLDNLRRVLSSVEILLKNYEACDTVISADHGNALGELGQYGHGTSQRVRSVCRVPWISTTAHDSGGYEPIVEKREPTNVSLSKRLRALGYSE